MRHFSGDFVGVRLLMDDELEKIAGGEGEDTDDVQDVAGAMQLLGQVGIAAIGGYLGNQAAMASQREARIESIFDPRLIARETAAWTNVGGMGTLVPAWEMQNGDMFIDTNRNNRPDLLFQTSPTGAIWSYDGSSRTQVYSPRN
jgi:hypothetical protein